MFSAFNSMLLLNLLDELMLLWLPGSLVCLIHNFYSSHISHVKGGILSFLLFLLYIKWIILNIGPRVRSLTYADDVIQCYEDAVLLTGQNVFIRCLESLQLWLEMKTLALSTDKTKILLFTIKYIQRDGVRITYTNTNLSLVSSHKYMDIYLDSKLNWLRQMKHLTARVLAAISILKAVSHTCWGGDPKILLLTYTSIIRPHTDYGPLFMRRNSLHISTTLQRLKNSSSVAAIYVEADILPYSLHQVLFIEKNGVGTLEQ
ncbi:hypothetical protein PR048_013442, partial [Dryococelus australis]